VYLEPVNTLLVDHGSLRSYLILLLSTLWALLFGLSVAFVDLAAGETLPLTHDWVVGHCFVRCCVDLGTLKQ
jgi:hypothetical protein